MPYWHLSRVGLKRPTVGNQFVAQLKFRELLFYEKVTLLNELGSFRGVVAQMVER